MYTVEQRRFLVHKYWQTGSFKACQTAFRTEFDERRAPSKCCIQKMVKNLETWGSRSNACRILSLEPNEGQSVQKYTPHNRTTQRRYSPRDSSRQLRHFGKSIPEFGETHSSVLGCERRPVSASIMSRPSFLSFSVCVYKFSSHYLNNITFIDNSSGSLATESPCTIIALKLSCQNLCSFYYKFQGRVEHNGITYSIRRFPMSSKSDSKITVRLLPWRSLKKKLKYH